MTEYNGVDSDVPIAYEMYNTTAAKIDGKENQELSKRLQIAPQLELKTERNQLGNFAILKAINKNIAK